MSSRATAALKHFVALLRHSHAKNCAAAMGRSGVPGALAPVYQSFEEGFGTPDLEDAHALLASL